MAQTLAPKQWVNQEVQGFIGVNLRQERASLADQELAKAINADLHSFPGVISLRYGRTAQFSSALTDLVIRRLARINSIRYQVAGVSLYRDQVSISAALSTNAITTILPARPLNDTTTWAFIADDALMRKDDGSTLSTWGIAAPTVQATVAAGVAGSLTGSYRVKYTFVRKVGASIAHESSPSPASSAQSLTSAVLAITNIADSADAQVTHKRIYRTVAGGSVYLYDQEIAQGVTSATSSVADTALGAAVEDDNDPPPTASWLADFQETFFLCRDAAYPHYLWYAKRFRPESWPVDQFLEIGNPNDPLQCAVATTALLGVFSRLTKYRVFGNASSGYVAQEAISRRGTPSPNGVVATETGIVFPARDGIFQTSLIAPDEELSARIAPIFSGEAVNDINAINWDAAETIAARSYKKRLYVALPTGQATSPDTVAVYSRDTQQWYFFDHPLRSLFVEEDLDDLVGGGTDGLVYVLEDGVSDAGTSIALDVETKDYFGQSIHTRKLFQWFRVDADVPSGSLTVGFYVDGTLMRSATVTGSRTRRLLALPASCLGYAWRLRFTYTGTARVKIYGAAAMWLPLEAA